MMRARSDESLMNSYMSLAPLSCEEAEAWAVVATDFASADADCDNGAGLHGTPRLRGCNGDVAPRIQQVASILTRLRSDASFGQSGGALVQTVRMHHAIRVMFTETRCRRVVREEA